MASNWNLLMDAMTRTPLSQYEVRVVAAIARKTLGWRKDADRISEYQLATMTGINRRHVARTLDQLERRNIIAPRSRARGRAATLALNLNIGEWRNPVELAPQEALVTSTCRGASPKIQLAPVEVPQLAPVQVHTRGKGLKKAAADAAALAQNELRQRAFDAWRESAGQVLNAKERGALAQQVTALAKSGSDAETILAAVRSLGRNREFPGFLTARVNEIEATGGVCRHDGRDRRVLSVAELERCGCGRCREWLDRKRVAA